AFAAGILLLISSRGSWAQEYTVTVIGALPDATPSIPTPPTSRASAINAYGVVAGSSAISGGFLKMTAEPWISHGVRWVDGELQDLGVLGLDAPPDVFPRPASSANGLNTLGQVVGDATIAARSLRPASTSGMSLWA